MNKHIDYIESKGFDVRGRYISKRSQKTNRKEVCGIINESTFYMFSDNVYPFKAGVNYFDNKTLTDVSELRRYVRSEVKKERNDFNITFSDYNNATKSEDTLTEYYNTISKQYLARPFNNYYDVKGVDVFTAFPFIDYNNNFITAQLIKYNDNGKRLKSGYSTTWLHSHKQAKKNLNLSLTDKYSVKVNCFFGEHYLKDSNKPIAIVEAPKTAIFLKHLYPNIDWIATAGESALFNKDLSVLDNKQVILYPDCNTTQWREFAEINGFSISDVLERNNCESGSDLADYVLTSSHDAYTDINAELYAIENNEYDFEYNEDLLELNYTNNNKNLSYLVAVPYYFKGEPIHHMQDNSSTKKIVLKDKLFNIYDEKYNIINAQINWHKQKILKGGELRGLNQKEFINALHKCYTILKHLNKNLNVDAIFTQTLDKIYLKSNIEFNKKYVLKRLVPIWNNQDQNLMHFVKQRKWKYKGNTQLSRKDFITELNNTRFRLKLETHLNTFKKLLNSGEYIDIKDLFNASRTPYAFEKLNDLRNKWNKEVLGCANKKQVEKYRLLNSCTDYCDTTYRNNIYSVTLTCAKKINTLKESKGWSNELIADSIGLTRNDIGKMLKFKSNKEARKQILKTVNDLLYNIHNIEPTRTDTNGKKRITDFILKTKINALNKTSVNTKTAFPTKEKLISELKSATNYNKVIITEEIKYLNYLETISKKKKVV